MTYIKLFESWLAEGGWATAKTQGTVIKPLIIQDCVNKLKIVSTQFAHHCKSLELPPLEFSKPVGSGTWYEDDIESQPDKVYGDVDFMVSYPVLELTEKGERADEIASSKLYNAELFTFLEKQSYTFIDVEESKKISSDTSVKLVMMVQTQSGDGWIQVDLIVTHPGYKDWAIFRMTPIRNVKGFVIGNLYSSFGEVLELSIQPRGVRAKFSGSEMVSYGKRAGVEDRLLSANIETFMIDIAEFFWKESGTEKPFNPGSLKSWKMDPNNPTFENLVDGIKGVAEVLSELGEFGTVIKYGSSKSLLDAVKDRYIEKMEAAANADKLNKAETPAAVAARDKLRAFVEKYTDLAKKLL
jgi:hypothetical protein